MKDFLLSFINPLKMKRFRFMSVFIAMLIFIASVYVISFPYQIYINSHKDEYLSQKSYVNAYIDLPQTAGEEFLSLKAGQYKVNDKFEMVSTNTDNTFKVYEFFDIDIQLFEEEPKTVDFYFVFDVNDSLTKSLNQIKENYAKAFPDDSENKINYISYIYYLDTINEDIEINSEYQNNRFAQLHNVEEEKLKEQMDKITNFDLFNIEPIENSYLLVFMKSSLLTQIPHYDEKAEKMTYRQLSAYYNSKMQFDFTNVSSLQEFGNHYVDLMFEPLIETDKTNYLLQVIGYVILFPAIYVLILCWTMKKRGIMKTFKEYYNVASIASVLPLIVTFILSWFIPNVVIIYGLLFTVFTLFVFIKINSTPELGD